MLVCPVVILQRSHQHIALTVASPQLQRAASLTSFKAAGEDVMERVKRGVMKKEWWSDVWAAADNLSDTTRCLAAISGMVVARQQHPL